MKKHELIRLGKFAHKSQPQNALRSLMRRWARCEWLRALVGGLALVSAGVVCTTGSHGRPCSAAAQAALGPLRQSALRACAEAAQASQGDPPGRLHLRGGYQETERLLQARMAAARAEVEEGWYNATATDVFPWHGWETAVRDELAGAPHVGFLAGTGRWLGPSLAQEQLAHEIDAEVADLCLEAPAVERTRRFLRDADAQEQARQREGDWPANSQQTGDVQQHHGSSSMFAALEREEADFVMLDAKPKDGDAVMEAGTPDEETDGSEAGPGADASDGHGTGEAETATVAAGGGAGDQETDRERHRERDSDRDRQPLADVVAPAIGTETGGGWGEMRGRWRERAAMPLRSGQKFVHVEHDPETGLRLEFVADDDTSGGSDVDINKAALPAGWTGEDSEDERALADYDARQDQKFAEMNISDAFPQHGYNMAAGKKWDGFAGMGLGATGTKACALTSKPLPNPAGPRPLMSGTRPWAQGDPRLAPGGRIYRAALETEGGETLELRDPPIVYQFPRLAPGTAFTLDPNGSGALMPLPSDLAEAQRKASEALAAVRRPQNTTLCAIPGSGRGKWAVREGWAGPEFGLEGLQRAWKVREVLGGKYRSFHAPDEMVFFDLNEAVYYGNLSRLERMEYRYRRVTRIGGTDASYATVDMADLRPVFSRPDSIYGDMYKQEPSWNPYTDDVPAEQPPVALPPLPPGWGPEEGAGEKLAWAVCRELVILINGSRPLQGKVLGSGQAVDGWDGEVGLGVGVGLGAESGDGRR
jgi:hypothetical protein